MTADPSSPSPEPAPHEPNTGRGGRLALWGVAIAVLAVGMLGGHRSSGAAPPAVPPVPSAGFTAPADPREPGEALPRSEPTRLLIPKISVNAPFTPLSIGATGQLEPPPAGDTNLVGWYAKGATPGERGTAIIAGHVDTKTSAAVFAGLYALRPGDRFSVERADGRTAQFVVDDAENFPKDDFPSRRVYADTARPEVRLITCSGDYDHSVRDYTENLVVFAHLV
ncbi:class F sortase [Streptomyces lucensis JCM 4490]|uniref:Class F sortase n=1 Tax=Streptomyces lucensis JCM 4490 TaxID=1306176 RepID=A0A918MVP0_9ACTN|nr:class F sortase [Streptomyces lucensis]GGW76941.1 class F sortase [Streptomyces lucensis JCM 4490]